jgi:hypothetical protein
MTELPGITITIHGLGGAQESTLVDYAAARTVCSGHPSDFQRGNAPEGIDPRKSRPVRRGIPGVSDPSSPGVADGKRRAYGNPRNRPEKHRGRGKGLAFRRFDPYSILHSASARWEPLIREDQQERRSVMQGYGEASRPRIKRRFPCFPPSHLVDSGPVRPKQMTGPSGGRWN